MSDTHDDYINREEIERNALIGAAMLEESDDDLQTRISDAFANLLILGQENEVPLADALVKGMAHFCATYIEGMDSDDAYEWLNTTLFPFTGEREFVAYVADDAIVLAGLKGSIEAPEWGV